MNKEDNFKGKFKQALDSTVKVISDDYKPNKDSKNSSSKNLNFFEIDNLNSKQDFIQTFVWTFSGMCLTPNHGF